MIVSLFRRSRHAANQRVVDAVFELIVAAARHRTLYADWGMPDTPLGRYESLGLHMILFLRRTRAQGPEVEALAQDVVDEFFKDVDHSIRELGVGDVGVPKRMKKLGRMFYGRMGSYWAAIDADDPAALSEALARNIMPGDPASAGLKTDAIARYMMDGARYLADQPNDDLLAARLRFLQPETAP